MRRLGAPLIVAIVVIVVVACDRVVDLTPVDAHLVAPDAADLAADLDADLTDATTDSARDAPTD